MKMKKHEPMVKPSDDGGDVSAPEVAVETKSSNITCSYGIHRGKFPVAGMKIKDARLVLKKLIKVDDSAAAVINGAVVGEETVILSDVTMLSFVKPSAVKGSEETITIQDRFVKMDGAKQIGVDKFCGLVSQNTVSGMSDEPIPDNVKWIVKAGTLEVYIVELKPELRCVNWSGDADKRDKTKYKKYKLATPYVILAVPFNAGVLHPCMELFYRTLPLKSLDDPLFSCNLLNVSMGARVAGHSGHKTWVCTQYLNMQGVKGHADSLSEVISHVFGGGFNRSSDQCEGASGFSTYEKKLGTETPLSNVQMWEKESEKNPRFVLDAEWMKAGCTPRDLIQFRMNQFKVSQYPETSKALGNILLASRL